MVKKDRPLLNAVRDVFIDSSGSSLASTDADLQKLSWREAGHLAVGISVLGLVCFGLHYLFFGTGKGEPPRHILIMIFSIMALGTSGVFRWKYRLRFLCAYTAAMAVVGLFLRFVVRETVAFSPAYLACQALLVIVLWAAFDWNGKLRARAKTRKAIGPGRIPD
jgi:hypothetical protein